MKNFLASPIGIRLRSAARSTGLINLLKPFLASSAYEARFGQELMAAIRVGDCVWDVGANVGLYTKHFTGAVGEKGTVVSFEPSPRNYQELRGNCSGLPNANLQNLGLGSSEASIGFVIGDAPNGVTDHIAAPGEKPTHQVSITTADQFVLTNPSLAPNVVKIDVEGFETEVLRGMTTLLKDSPLRAIFVEVHFAEMERRGNPQGPKEVEAMIKGGGFQTSWIDLSHVCGVKSPAHSRA
jgi:FkbM family methyltransferase